MTPWQITALAVRLLAIYSFISSFVFVGDDIFLFFFDSTITPGIPITRLLRYALPFTCYIGFGVLLWVFSEPLSYFLVKDNGSEDIDVTNSLSSYGLLTIGFCIVGLWAMLQAVRPITLALWYSFMPPPSWAPYTYLSNGITGLFFIGFGLMLVLQAHKFTHYLSKRYQFSDKTVDRPNEDISA